MNSFKESTFQSGVIELCILEIFFYAQQNLDYFKRRDALGFTILLSILLRIVHALWKFMNNVIEVICLESDHEKSPNSIKFTI